MKTVFCNKKDCSGEYVKVGGVTHTKWESYETYICKKCGKEQIKIIKGSCHK